MRHHHIPLAALVLTCCALILSACSGENDKSRITGSGFYFDTIVSITVYDEKDSELPNECLKMMEEYESIFSPTLTSSELYLLNSASREALKSGGEALKNVRISRPLYDVIESSLKYCSLSDGKYDITIRPVSELWDFHSDEAMVPDSRSIDEALSLVDYRGISLSGAGEDLTISFDRPGMMIDLGSSVKGYVADRLRDMMISKGCARALIDLGGNILVIGYRDEEASVPYSIGIASPIAGSETAAVVSVHDCAVVTSGTYERYFMRDGKRYHHILDAGTGYPAEGCPASVSIISGDAFTSDILSTFCLLLGPEESEKLKAGGVDFSYLYLYEDGSSIYSKDFSNYL